MPCTVLCSRYEVERFQNELCVLSGRGHTTDIWGALACVPCHSARQVLGRDTDHNRLLLGLADRHGQNGQFDMQV